MKNVLIICGTFPPQSEVGGLRPAMFAKYLKEFGWNPLILTRIYPKQDPRYDEKMPIELPKINDQVFKVDYSLDNEKAYLENRNFIDKIRDFIYPEYSSPPGLYFAMKEKAIYLLANNKIDIIFSTSPDQWELTLGSWISKKYHIPLVADFRDIKEQEEGLKRTLRTKLQIIRFLNRRFITTRKASLITTVSEYHATRLSKKLKRKTVLIYNGYDADHFKPVSSNSVENKEFRIIYVGRILNIWYQNPKILFDAIDQLIIENRILCADITVEFYGTEEEKLHELISKLKNPNFIRIFPRISFETVPTKLNEAQLLLLLTNRGRKGIITTKFFEYAGVKKPILCIPGDENELDELIEKYGLGYSISDIDKLKIKIVEWVDLHKKDNFPKQITSQIDFFTRKNQAKILADAFSSVIGE